MTLSRTCTANLIILAILDHRTALPSGQINLEASIDPRLHDSYGSNGCSPQAFSDSIRPRAGVGLSEADVVDETDARASAGPSMSNDLKPDVTDCEAPDLTIVDMGAYEYDELWDDDPDGDSMIGRDDLCPLDPLKLKPGVGGCGTSDDDSDVDDFVDCIAWCPTEAGPILGCPAVGACCFSVGVCINNADPGDCTYVGDAQKGHLSICNDGCLLPGDLDGDADIDLFDGSELVECMTGPGGIVKAECALADADQDGDVDPLDVTILQNVFTGDLAAGADGNVQPEAE